MKAPVRAYFYKLSDHRKARLQLYIVFTKNY